jgi:hypothetical protein
MREAVELCADLAELREDNLLVAPAAIAAGIHVRALHLQLEPAARREWHVGVQHAAELEDFTGAD